MLRDFSWYLRECALREYAIYSEKHGDLAERAFNRCLRFIAMADLLHPTFTSFDLEYEYCSRKGDYDFEDEY